MDISQYLPLFKAAFDYGVPTGLLLLIALGVYRVAAFLAGPIRELFHWLFEVLKAHVQYLSVNSEAATVNASTMNEIKNVLLEKQTAHAITHQAIIHVGDAIHAAAAENRKPEVKHHVDAIREVTAKHVDQ